MTFQKQYKAKKKPVVVDAYQTKETKYIGTLEGTMKASAGDWIITGVNGEQYPVKEEIFNKTYELLEEN
ncbi:MAG: hypothetical protein GX317_07715 [Staphylococcus equorum]|nr:hypothetical protein [Staphylococcus equorum]